MAEVVFTAEENAPGGEDLDAALGRSRAAWRRLRQFLAESYDLDGEWAYYGRKSGWVLRYRKGGKALTTLSPYKGYFTVQIVLGRADHEAAREATLGASTREAIAAAHPYHDGRWLFLPINKVKDLEDVYTLLRVKRKPRGAKGK
ncbi:MAG: DUF3788 domain-containing protein [Candidatus Coatesbacteria bacterium]|nr:MAG: DUF3788 domain-containing protein [Candidatus Coatesbacteria bacterium]